MSVHWHIIQRMINQVLCLSWIMSINLLQVQMHMLLLTHTHDDVIKWKHFSALLAICAGNSPIPGEFSTKRPVTRSFDIFLDLRLNIRLSKQSWGWWFETLSRLLWRHRNVLNIYAPEHSLNDKSAYRKISWSLTAMICCVQITLQFPSHLAGTSVETPFKFTEPIPRRLGIS